MMSNARGERARSRAPQKGVARRGARSSRGSRLATSLRSRAGAVGFVGVLGASARVRARRARSVDESSLLLDSGIVVSIARDRRGSGRDVTASSARSATSARPPAFAMSRGEDLSSYVGPTDYCNWVIKDQLMAGGYPASVDDDETDELLLTLIRDYGFDTFVCLQEEVNAHAPERAWRGGRAPRPYMHDIRRIMSQHKRDIPFPKVDFLHLPIVDGSVTADALVDALCDDLIARIRAGRRLYVHCWGGHGRTGTVVAIILGRMYDITCAQALARTQTLHDVRGDPQNVGSPSTPVQRLQVRRLLEGGAATTTTTTTTRTTSLRAPPARRDDATAALLDARRARTTARESRGAIGGGGGARRLAPSVAAPCVGGESGARRRSATSRTAFSPPASPTSPPQRAPERRRVREELAVPTHRGGSPGGVPVAAGGVPERRWR